MACLSGLPDMDPERSMTMLRFRGNRGAGPAVSSSRSTRKVSSRSRTVELLAEIAGCVKAEFTWRVVLMVWPGKVFRVVCWSCKGPCGSRTPNYAHIFTLVGAECKPELSESGPGCVRGFRE